MCVRIKYTLSSTSPISLIHTCNFIRDQYDTNGNTISSSRKTRTIRGVPGNLLKNINPRRLVIRLTNTKQNNVQIFPVTNYLQTTRNWGSFHNL